MARRDTNAFGEPWQGSTIRGAGALARARGYAYGNLTSQQRGQFGSQANFQAAAEQAVRSQTSTPNPSGETEEQREERLKKKGREEVMKREPEFVKKPEPMASRLNAAGEVSLSKAGADTHDGLMRYGSDNEGEPAPAKERVKWSTPNVTPAYLSKMRRAINRREQRPAMLSSGQPNRSNW